MAQLQGITVATETKATVTGRSGRVLAWHNDREPHTISIAVPGERAVLDPAQVRAFAKWLTEQADILDSNRLAPMADRLRDAERQEAQRRASMTAVWPLRP
jgi:hypothetical protein